MRTDLRLFHLDKFAVPTDVAIPAELPSGLLQQGVDLGGSIVSYNGQTIKSELAEELKSQGIIFGSIAEVLQQNESLLQEYLLTKAVDPHFDKFSALHAAFFTGGQVLYVPKNTVVKKPLHAVSILGDQGVDLGHTLVIVEEGAEVTMLNETASLDDRSAGLHCGAIEVNPASKFSSALY